jgi:hypothetical protein
MAAVLGSMVEAVWASLYLASLSSFTVAKWKVVLFLKRGRLSPFLRFSVFQRPKTILNLH